jgi:hypothetical protein
MVPPARPHAPARRHPSKPTCRYCATRGYSKSEFPRFIALMLDNPLFDPKRCPRALRDYFFDAIPAFLAELRLPHPCWLAGIRTIECGAHVVEDELDERRARMDGQVRNRD